MIACAKLQQGSVSPSSLAKRGWCGSASAFDVERHRMTGAVNVTVVSASIAVYRC